jgi:predicted nucleotidyltransferase component of viral defense system
MLTPDNPYYGRVQLLMRVLPHIAKESVFALKGGTAINLFIRDMPRLSVDIDLAYLPLESRDAALVNIERALERIGHYVQQQMSGVHIHKQQTKSGIDYRLLVQQAGEEIVIETTPVMRGTINPPVEREVQKQVEQVFGYVKMPVSSFEDLYAGKICAALHRQHPRDLFDINILYEHEGLHKSLHQVFLVYLLCGNRPIAEMLQPKFHDLRTVFERQFLGMSLRKVSLEDLQDARKKLLQDIHRLLTEEQKQFLLSFKSGDPDWALWSGPEMEKLPAIQWKLRNIKNMTKQKHQAALKKLEKVLYG